MFVDLFFAAFIHSVLYVGGQEIDEHNDDKPSLDIVKWYFCFKTEVEPAVARKGRFAGVSFWAVPLLALVIDGQNTGGVVRPLSWSASEVNRNGFSFW